MSDHRDESIRISLDQLSRQVLRVDKLIQPRMSDSYEHHHIMAYMVQSWKQQVDAMERMLYGMEPEPVGEEERITKSANIVRGLLATITAEESGWLRESLEEILKLLTS